MAHSKHAERVRARTDDYCTYCGARLADPNRPDALPTESFCDDDCEDAWNIDAVATR